LSDGTDTKTKLDALKERLVPLAKAADLLAVARELEVLGATLAREEAGACNAAAWPRDMNEPTDRPSEWGKDSKEGARG
jgi:hypothetical protein